MDDVKDSALRGQEYEDFFRSLPYEQGVEVSGIEKETEFEAWCKSHGVDNPNTIWSAKQDYERSLYSPLEPEGENQAKKIPGETGKHHAERPHHFSWTDNMKRVEDESRAYAEEKAAEWNKSHDFSKARNFFDAYGQAQREFYDDYAKKNPKLAQILAKSMGNGPMRDALRRIEIAQKTQIFKEVGFDQEQRRRIIEAEIAGTGNPIAPNTLSNIGTPNVLGEAQAPATSLPPNTLRDIKTQSEPHDEQTPTATPQEKGFRKRLSSFGPRAIARKAKTRLMNSRLGKRLSSSKLGKFAGKVKRFGNKVSGIKRKINKFISPLDYFSKLLRRSIITSVISALSAALSAMATAATVLLSSLIAGAITAGVFAATAISKIIVAITGTITTVVGALAGPQIIVVIVVALIIAIAAILFGPAAPGRAKQYSPYPGIYYSINSEYPKVANGQNIKYKIIVLYNPEEAEPSLDELLLVDKLPPGTTLVPEGTTGIYDSTSRPGIIVWKLSKNTPTKNTDDGISYDFDLILNPQDDLTVENKITIETGDLADNPGGGDLTGLYEGIDSLPSNNTCGEYAGVMSDLSKSWPEMGENTNFGDPACSYKPERFTQLLEITETKTENIPFWKDIVSLEGAIMTVGNLRDGDGKIIRQTNGPFGKFQMSRSTPPGKKWTEVGPRGDTTWQKQIENAVGYNKNLAQSGNNFGYWGSAMCLCWWPKYRTQSYCKDIVSKGPSNITGPRAPEGNNCPTNTGLTCNTAVRCENDKAIEIGKRGPRQ